MVSSAADKNLGHDALNSEQAMKKAFDEKLSYRIVLLSNMLGRPFFEGIDAKYKISLNDWRIILVLKFHPNVSATDICALTGLQKMTVSRSVRALLKQSYIGLGPDPVDGRRKIIQLTRAGKAVFMALFPGAVARDKQMRSGLNDEEHRIMLRLTNKLIATIQDADM